MASQSDRDGNEALRSSLIGLLWSLIFVRMVFEYLRSEINETSRLVEWLPSKLIPAIPWLYTVWAVSILAFVVFRGERHCIRAFEALGKALERFWNLWNGRGNSTEQGTSKEAFIALLRASRLAGAWFLLLTGSGGGLLLAGQISFDTNGEVTLVHVFLAVLVFALMLFMLPPLRDIKTSDTISQGKETNDDSR